MTALQITQAQFQAACEAAARSEFESASKWESYARATRAALTTIGVTVKEEATAEPTVGAVLVLIERWIAMANELPADPVQVLRDLSDCIEGKGAYANAKEAT